MYKTIGDYTYLIDDVTSDILGYAPDEQEEVTDTLTDTTQRKCGRPTKITPNPIYALIRASAELNPTWLDDIIYGACVTSGGLSNGRMNVKPRYVLRTLMQPTISVNTAAYGLGANDRTKRRIAQAARHALGGISRYLERHPETYTRLNRLADIEGHANDCFTLGELDML